MTKPITQDGAEIREMTEAEFSAWQVLADEAAERKAVKIEKAKAKTALLEKLGITAEEANLLLS